MRLPLRWYTSRNAIAIRIKEQHEESAVSLCIYSDGNAVRSPSLGTKLSLVRAIHWQRARRCDERRLRQLCAMHGNCYGARWILRGEHAVSAAGRAASKAVGVKTPRCPLARRQLSQAPALRVPGFQPRRDVEDNPAPLAVESLQGAAHVRRAALGVHRQTAEWAMWVGRIRIHAPSIGLNG